MTICPRPELHLKEQDGRRGCRGAVLGGESRWETKCLHLVSGRRDAADSPSGKVAKGSRPGGLQNNERKRKAAGEGEGESHFKALICSFLLFPILLGFPRCPFA